MIKKICDRCGKEIKESDIIFEGRIIEKKALMIPLKGKSFFPGQEIKQRIIHLCSVCTIELKDWLNRKKR